ncbi:PCI-domain-containing protein [Cylindrobasidium torrendii FP15055 ss-10]|uniref:Eukaryotic translation initiation factor 3 subunit M n=1 Tax=Cylindrobasidium torrendii FP15055 ss-10 TaxID=1314674 RepID=A0A0D7BMV6_9AGAR|nr:PCI-domain-containing protein [Cylindrobasidium torrendii FP15055 ss-10]
MDSISVFTEGTFEEQIQELVGYIARNKSEEERSSFVRQFSDAFKSADGARPLSEDLGSQQRVFEMLLKETLPRGLGDGNEKEIEGFFNMIFSHLLSLWPTDSETTKENVSKIIELVEAAPESHTAVKYKLLTNLFNALPRTSGLRYSVYTSLLKISLPQNAKIEQPEVSRYLSEWSISDEERTAFLKTLVDAYSSAGQPFEAYNYQLAYVRSLPASSTDAAIDLIASALRLPDLFDFDPLYKIDAVVSAKDNELFALLQVFLSGGLDDYLAWVKAHEATLAKFNLEAAALERKIRLLTLSSLASEKIGQNVSFAQIAEALQIDIAEVEKWVIDVIRAGLVSAKISQIAQTVRVNRATARSFERPQWESLEKRLVAWKSGLAGVLEVVAQARQSIAPPTSAK